MSTDKDQNNGEAVDQAVRDETQRLVEEGRERERRNQSLFRSLATDLAFNTHVRRVHDAVRHTKAEVLAGHGDSTIVQMSTPGQKDVDDGVAALQVAYDAGRRDGLIDGGRLERENRARLIRTQQFVEGLAREEKRAAARLARRKRAKKARKR